MLARIGMNTQSLILAILNFGDATGYEIKKQSTEGAFSFFVDISYGTIYPTLARLEAEGFVSSRSEIQSGRPDKKVYALTEKGREEFVRLLDALPQKDKFKSEFLLIAMCADLCRPDLIEKAVDKQIGEVRDVLAIIEEMDQDCDHPSTRWVTNFGRHVKQAALDYLQNNKASLVAISANGTGIRDAAE